jgi:hypothetical protein
LLLFPEGIPKIVRYSFYQSGIFGCEGLKKKGFGKDEACWVAGGRRRSLKLKV